jgi:hypothetical protein
MADQYDDHRIHLFSLPAIMLQKIPEPGISERVPLPSRENGGITSIYSAAPAISPIEFLKLPLASGIPATTVGVV